MPLDDSGDYTVPQMRAKILQRLANQQTYDDGASLLGQNPDLLQVGLFGKLGKVTDLAATNLARRRALGLPEMPIPMAGESAGQLVPKSAEALTPTPQAPTPSTPQTPAPQPASPLGQLADKALNALMTRREVLQRAGQTALQQALPTPKVTDIAKDVVGTAAPLAEVSKAAPTATISPATAILNALRERMIESNNRIFDDDPMEAAHALDIFLQHAKPKDFEKGELSKIKRDFRNFSRLEDDPDMDYDEIQDLANNLIDHANKLGSKAPAGTVIDLLSGQEDMHAEDMAQFLLDKGFKREDIADFLDTHYPYFDYDEFMNRD